MQDLNLQIINTKTEYEVKLGQKDGEITRLEKMLSETRASLQDKSFQYSKTHSNLNTEVQSLHDRISLLEKEKLEIIDRHIQSEDRLRENLVEERERLTDKSSKLKTQCGELQDRCNHQDNLIREIEKKNSVLQKENEGLYSRIEEMNKAASEKFDHLKNIE
jgi:hypothetical protein